MSLTQIGESLTQEKSSRTSAPSISNPSHFQDAIFQEILDGTSSLIINAVAGSGKTTTIVHATSLIPRHCLTVFLAFNKRIAEELEKRVPSHIQVGTFHSRAFAALSRSLPKRPRVNKDKIRDILKSAQKSKLLSWEEYQTYSQFVVKLVSLAKSIGIGTELVEDEIQSWEELVSYHCLSPENGGEANRGIQIAQRVLEESNSDLTSIDFDDMLYLALKLKVRFDIASFIFIDEAQDTNGVQRALLKQMGNFQLGPKMVSAKQEGFMEEIYYSPSRLIAVGDPFQSIYGFRGADSSAMSLLQSEFSMKPMDLSICYRCSKAVIEEVYKKIKL